MNTVSRGFPNEREARSAAWWHYGMCRRAGAHHSKLIDMLGAKKLQDYLELGFDGFVEKFPRMKKQMESWRAKGRNLGLNV